MSKSTATQLAGFSEVLARRAVDQRDDLAFVFLDGRGQVSEQMSFGDLQQRVLALASQIYRLGNQGRNVLLALPTGSGFVVALFACFHAGAVAVPVPSLAGRRNLDRASAICRDARPASVLTTRLLAPEVRTWAVDPQGLPIPCLAIENTVDGAAMPAVHRQSSDVALLQYTSGSTANPKGVMLTHGNLLANSRMIAEAFGHDRTLRGVGWLPLFHDMGLIGHVLQPVYVGGLSVLMSPLSFIQRPVRWLEAISTWRATTSGGPSQAYALCKDKITAAGSDGLDLSHWRVAYCGAEPVRGTALEDFAQRFAGNGFRKEALQPCYGLAEATLLATSRGPGEGIRLADQQDNAARSSRGVVSCGRPWGEGTIAVVDAESGAALGEGTVGQICVSGPHVATGYWEQPLESAESFCREDAGEPRTILKTGDLGFMQDGELFVLGRLKNTIIVFGENHAAEDIEATVALSHPLFEGAVGAAFTIGGAHSGAEVPVVVQEIRAKHVDPDILATAEQDAAASVIRDHDLRLSEIILVKSGSLPRTSSGKVQRAACRDLYEGGQMARLNVRGHHAAMPDKALSA